MADTKPVTRDEEEVTRRQSLDASTETEPTRPYICAPSITEYPARVICPNCHAQVLTRTTHTNGLLTWICASGLCLLGCWFGCCLIPFFCDVCKDVRHSCPNCNNEIGNFRRL